MKTQHLMVSFLLIMVFGHQLWAQETQTVEYPEPDWLKIGEVQPLETEIIQSLTLTNQVYAIEIAETTTSTFSILEVKPSTLDGIMKDLRAIEGFCGNLLAEPYIEEEKQPVSYEYIGYRH